MARYYEDKTYDGSPHTFQGVSDYERDRALERELSARRIPTGQKATYTYGRDDAGALGVTGRAYEPRSDEVPSPNNGQLGNVATSAATGAAVAGPWGAIIAAAGSLLGGLIDQKDGEKARKLAEETKQRDLAQRRLFEAQSKQINTVGEMGNREQSAIQQMLGVFARSQR